jgi:hypothetical protein
MVSSIPCDHDPSSFTGVQAGDQGPNLVAYVKRLNREPPFPEKEAPARRVARMVMDRPYKPRSRC